MWFDSDCLKGILRSPGTMTTCHFGVWNIWIISLRDAWIMGCSWLLYESGLWIACASRAPGYATGPENVEPLWFKPSSVDDIEIRSLHFDTEFPT